MCYGDGENNVLGRAIDSWYFEIVIDHHNSHICPHDMHQQSVMASFTGTSELHQNEHDDDASVPTPPKFHTKWLVLLRQLYDLFGFLFVCVFVCIAEDYKWGLNFPKFCLELNFFYVSEIPIDLTFYFADAH